MKKGMGCLLALSQANAIILSGNSLELKMHVRDIFAHTLRAE